MVPDVWVDFFWVSILLGFWLVFKFVWGLVFGLSLVGWIFDWFWVTVWGTLGLD